MSADKYPSIFSRQMETIVYLYHALQNMVSVPCIIFWGFLALFYFSLLYFAGILSKTIIPLGFVGYEIVI